MRREIPLDEKNIGEFINIENEEGQKIEKGLNELEDELDRLSFMSGEANIIRGEVKEEGGTNIIYFISHSKSSDRANKFVVAQDKDKNSLIFVSTPRKIHALHQDILDALQRHIDKLECIGGGEIKLDPVSIYGSSSDYGEVPLEIRKKLQKEIENRMQ